MDRGGYNLINNKPSNMLVTTCTNSRILFTMPILLTPRESSTMMHGLRKGGDGEEGRRWGGGEMRRGGGEEVAHHNC